MGLVSKLKNILFEEEEVEIPVIEKKEKRTSEVQEVKELPRKEEVKVTNYRDYSNIEPVIREEVKMEEKVRSNNIKEDVVSERELFKNEKTFNFPAFDEDEFDHYVPKKRSTNVIEHERAKVAHKPTHKEEYKKEYKKPEEVKEVKKFKPSPIISPVYGILDKNYTPDEITTRTDMAIGRSLDVDTVRRKAFGSKVVNESEKKVIDKALEEKIEKARTIDELLKDSSDEVIKIDEENIEKNIDEPLSRESHLEKKKEEHQPNIEDDTLENDLFDLIDSMYEDREEDK